MRFILSIIITILTFSFSTIAQVLPNPSFELWSTDGPYEIANNWSSSNQFTFQINNQISANSSLNSFDGNLSAYIFTTNLGFVGSPYSGWIVNGIPQQNLATGEFDFFSAGTDFNLKPNKLKGYYKYENNYVSTDSANVVVYLKSFNSQTNMSDTVALGSIKLGATSFYTQFEVSIFDIAPNISPDSIVIVFSTTDISAPVSGGALWIDKLEYENLITEIREIQKPEIKISPNPTSDYITISTLGIDSDLKINIYNSLGKVVRLCRLNNTENSYDIQLKGLQPGIYFVKSIHNNKKIDTQKLILQR